MSSLLQLPTENSFLGIKTSCSQIPVLVTDCLPDLVTGAMAKSTYANLLAFVSFLKIISITARENKRQIRNFFLPSFGKQLQKILSFHFYCFMSFTRNVSKCSEPELDFFI
jgi:hypothetical protein